MSKRNYYANVCVACEHLLSGHSLVDGGDFRRGPYRCELCPCEVPQEAPFYGLSKAQYDRFIANDHRLTCGEFSERA